MAKSVKENGVLTETLIDDFFAWLKKTAYSNFVENNEKWFTKVGLGLMYFIAIMSFLSALVLVMKYNALSVAAVLGGGIVGAVVAIVFQYIAAKTLPCLNILIKNTPAKLSSTAILQVFAFAVGIFGILSLFGGLVLAIKTSSFELFLIWFAVAVICEYWLAIALNPESLNIEVVKDISAGEEFIGILTFFAKGSLKLVPLIFCGCMIFVAYQLVYIMFAEFAYIGQISMQAGIIAYALCGALLPLIFYLSFIGYYFTIDIARAILSIPAKLDKNK